MNLRNTKGKELMTEARPPGASGEAFEMPAGMEELELATVMKCDNTSSYFLLGGFGHLGNGSCWYRAEATQHGASVVLNLLARENLEAVVYQVKQPTAAVDAHVLALEAQIDFFELARDAEVDPAGLESTARALNAFGSDLAKVVEDMASQWRPEVLNHLRLEQLAVVIARAFSISAGFLGE